MKILTTKLGKLITGALLIALTIIVSNRPVVSYTLKTAEPSPQPITKTVEIAQVGSSNYYEELAKADDFYKKGNPQMAVQIQQQVKPDFPPSEPLEGPIFEEENLKNISGGAVRWWQTANQGIEQNLESKIVEPLKLLTQTYPQFIPAHLLLAEQLVKIELDHNPEDKKAVSTAINDAITVLNRGSSLYPEVTELLDARIAMLRPEKRYLEAAIAANQFVLSYPDHPKAQEYRQIAQQNEQDHQKYMQDMINAGGIASELMGMLMGQNSSSQTSMYELLKQGESVTGEQFAQQYKATHNMVNNEQVVSYVNQVGQKLAKYMGRDEFNYEFFVVEDPSYNAFAYPGGKIFVNTGMLKAMGSEAQLAGLLSHELSHSVLSHGFEEMVSKASLEWLTGIGDEFLFQLTNKEDIVSTYLISEQNRTQEQQSDIVGTRALASAGYSADGLYIVTTILKQLDASGTAWDSTHPAPTERVAYLGELIEHNGYNRFAYEGVKDYQTAMTSLNTTAQKSSEKFFLTNKN